jgi:hypothetical protein
MVTTRKTYILLALLILSLLLPACTTEDAEGIGWVALNVRGELDADGNRIIEVGYPDDDADAASKEYVDYEIAENVPVIITGAGTAIVYAGSNATIVTHNLPLIPELENISITPHSLMGDAHYWYLSSANSTNFTINLDADPVAVDVTLGWMYIKVEE